MSGWRSTPSVTHSDRGTAPNDAWRNWKPNFTKIKETGHAVIFPKCTATTWMEEHPAKRRAINKYKLFNLLPTSILNVIEIWIVGLEHSINLKSTVT